MGGRSENTKPNTKSELNMALITAASSQKNKKIAASSYYHSRRVSLPTYISDTTFILGNLRLVKLESLVNYKSSLTFKFVYIWFLNFKKCLIIIGF